MIFDKGVKTIQWEKMVFPTNGAVKVISMCKRMKLVPYLTS